MTDHHNSNIVSLEVHRGARPGSEPARPERSDDELLLLVRGGVREAFDTLVQRHQARALRIAAKYLGDPVAAGDAVQNAFLQIYLAVHRYRPDGKFKAYLYRVVLNQCRMMHRARRTRAGASQRAALDPLEAVGEDGPAPDSAILAQQRRRVVERALARLSHKQREVLALRFAGELSYREVAEVLDLPLGTVKRRVFDGLVRLRGLLEGRSDDLR